MRMSVLSFRSTRLSDSLLPLLPTVASIRSLPVLVGVAAVLPYASLLLTGELVFADSPYCDYSSFQVPMREFAQRELAAGRFPHWNPWVGCGIPMHATQQVALCYPLLTPLLLLFSANMATKISLLLHVALAYAGQYRLARKLNISSAGAAIAGLIVAQCGFLTNHLAVGHIAMVLQFGILPWFFLNVVSTCRGPSWSATLGIAITVGGLLLIGHPQVPYYAFLIGGLWTAGSLLCGAAAKRRFSVCGHFIVGFVVALLLGAIQLVPAIELARDNRGLSERGTKEYASQYALDCVDVYRLFFPSLRGNPLVEIPEFKPPDFFHEKVCYVGLITWWFILVGIFGPSKDRWTRAATWLSIFAVIISLGSATILFGAIGRFIPGLFLFRCPGRFLGVATLLLALLAGRGFDLVRTRQMPFSGYSPWRMIAVLLVMDAALMFVVDQSIVNFDWTQWTKFAGQHLQGDAQMSIMIILASAALVFWSATVSERMSCAMAVAILIADLGFFNVRGVRYDVEDMPDLPATVVNNSEQFRFVEGPQSLRFSKDSVRYSRYVPQAVRSQMRMIGTNEGGVLPASCETLYRSLQDNPGETLRQASCRAVVSGSRSPEWTQVTDPLPRIRFVPGGTATAETQSPAEPPRIETLTDEPQMLVARLKAPTNGEFVVADTFYPGWTALVDGQPAEIHSVGDCFRGISLPAGDHLIQMQFRSESFILGTRLSALGLASLALLLWLALGKHPAKLSPATPIIA